MRGMGAIPCAPTRLARCLGVRFVKGLPRADVGIVARGVPDMFGKVATEVPDRFVNAEAGRVAMGVPEKLFSAPGGKFAIAVAGRFVIPGGRLAGRDWLGCVLITEMGKVAMLVAGRMLVGVGGRFVVV